MEENLEKYRKTIELCSSIMKDIKAERMSNTKMGKYVNVFSLWNEFSGISEPIHSRILHFFLSDNPMHGQGKLFLSAFLEYIGFEKDKGNEEWIITAEEGRVDVLLRRLNPLGAVIIENKSNWAEDQPNQLYRYWYENIHKREEDCCTDYYSKHPEYKIVYLVPDKAKHINSNSTSRPVDYPEDLPEELPMKPKVMTFHTDIPKWLGGCMKGLPAENTPLRNLIAQYIEYCKQL
jgi:hypothetical protein